jgi:DNA-binding NarL/FixJ family response regulator
MTLAASKRRILVVDRAALWRSVVRRTLSVPGIEIVGEAETPDVASKLAVQFNPDVILLDVLVAGLTNYDLVRDLTVRVPGSRIVMFSNVADHREAVRALSCGAYGYLTKDVSASALMRAIRGTLQGDLPMSRRIAAKTMRHFVDAVRYSSSAGMGDEGLRLTDREMEIVRKMADGMTDRQIASALAISTRTVESHVGSVLRKLGVPNRATATRWFLLSRVPSLIPSSNRAKGGSPRP